MAPLSSPIAHNHTHTRHSTQLLMCLSISACVCVCVCDGGGGGGVSTTVGSVSCKQTTRELLLYGKIKTSKHNRDKVALLCYSLRPSITSLLCISIFYDSGCFFFVHPLKSKPHRYQQAANDGSVFGSCTFVLFNLSRGTNSTEGND